MAAVTRKQILARDDSKCAVDGLPAADAHHRWLKGQGGPDSYGNRVALCRACHDWCHDHETGAARLGLILASHPVPVPAREPLPRHGYGWVLLGDDGGITPLAPTPRQAGPVMTPADWLAATIELAVSTDPWEDNS
jgi:hypothetical protein